MRRSGIPFYITITSALFSVLLGVAIIFWYYGIYWTQGLHSNFLLPFKPNTAAYFFLMGSSLFILVSRRWGRLTAGKIVGIFLPTVVLLLAVGAWFFDHWGLAIRIELFPKAAELARQMGHPPYLTTMTAFCIATSSLALLSAFSRTMAIRLISHMFSVAALVTSLFVLIGYLYSTSIIAVIGETVPNAWLKYAAFGILNSGILFANPDLGLARILQGQGYGSFVARRLFFASLIVLPVLGWLRTWGELQGYYSFDTGLALMVFSSILVVGTMVFLTARRLNQIQREVSSQDVLFRQLVGSTKDYSIIMLDTKGRILSWNEGAERMTGYKESEVLGKEISLLHTPENRSRNQLQFEIEEASNHGKYEEEGFRVRKNGSRFWAHVTTTKVTNEDGEVIGFANVTQDMTDRKKSEELIKRSEAQFRSLADLIPQLAWMTDEKGSIVWYNQKWYEFTGLNFEESRAWGWQKVHHPDHLDRVVKHYKESLEHGDAWSDTFPLRSRTGEYRWFLSRANPIRDDEGNVISWFGTNTDITEERNAQFEREQLLKELEAKTGLLQTVLEQMPAAVIIADAPSGRLMFGNRKVDTIWRHPLKHSSNVNAYSEWVGFHPDGRRYEGKDWPLARSILTGEIVENEDTPVLRGDGTRGVIRLSSAPVRNSKGEIIAGVVICEDVTDLQKSQLDLLRAKEAAEAANQAKSEFLANMSHEIRTPMNAVLGFSELLMEEDLTEDEKKEYLRRIRSAGSHLIRLIDDILDLSRVDSGRLQIEKLNFSVIEVIRGVFDALSAAADSKGIELKLIFKSEIPQVIFSDAVRFRQILINLIGNSIKFTDRGHVHVKLEFVPAVRPQGESYLRIDIEDSGIGISKSAQANLFSLFGQADSSVTRRYGGTGLGLALSRKLTRALGGDLQLQKSEPGQGSCFRIEIPTGDVSNVVFIDQPEKWAYELSVESTGRRKANLPGVRVLLAEDSPDNIMLMRVFLESEGALIHLAHDGLEAVQAAIKKDFDIVLMDIQMPNLSGIEATRRLRAQGFNKPILAVTAHALKDEVDRSMQAGCDAHITKPVNRKDLVAMIKKHLARPRPPLEPSNHFLSLS